MASGSWYRLRLMPKPDAPLGAPAQPLTRTQWLICIIAAIGFAFDIYELLMMPVIQGRALAELLGVPEGSPEIRTWIGRIQLWSAQAGGFFGLIGGYLTDRFGRRRVLVWSILLYAFSALAAGFSTSVYMLLFFRCTTWIGVCVEFVAAVAWLAELFPDPRRREKVLGYTQAFSSLGGFLVTGASWLATAYAEHLPAIQGAHSAWRYTLISGVIPALPLLLIRPFLPESPAWREKREAGTLKRPSFLELFSPAYRRTTLVTALMFACSYGAAFGAIQLTPAAIVPGLTKADKDRALAEKAQIEERLKAIPDGSAEKQAALAQEREAVARLKQIAQAPNAIQFWQELGGLLGRFTLAFLAVRIVSRRSLLRVFQAPGLVIVPLVFLFPARMDLDLLKVGIFLAGFFTVAQFSFWGNYLPRVYPLHLRGTGESFAANVGGRMVGGAATFFTANLVVPYVISPLAPDASPSSQTALGAALVALLVYAVGSAACFFLPEPKGDQLPE